jgi:hypothetical protein
MAKGAEEIWVCANCRSVNRIRAKQCYNCRTPQHLAAVDPETMSVTDSGPVREIELPPYKGSRGRAMLASICVLAIAFMQIASVVIVSDLIVGFFAGNEITEGDVRIVNNLGLASLGAALFALVTWSAWLSRVVAGMPALGLGYPAATGFTAFFENFVPVRNLFTVPAIVRDVIGRLEEYPARGNALIAAAWIGIFGGFIVPRVGSWLIAIGADSEEMAIRNQLILAAISTGLTVVGAVFLVWLIWWIEVRITRRRHVQAADAAPVQPIQPLQPPLPDATPVQTIISAAGDGTSADSPVPSAAP